MAYNLKSGASGAMSGAAAGSVFGPWGAAAGGVLGGLGGFGSSPGDDAKKYYDQIPGTIKPYYDPYVNAGNWSLDKLKQQYSGMMDDPGSIIKQLGQGYQKSPGYDWRMQQGQGAISNANAAGGMAGTQQHMQQAGQMAENMAGDDYNNYLSQALGLYGMGTQGAQGMMQQGYGASSDLATSLAQALMSQGNLGYAQGHNENQSMMGSAGNFYGAFTDKPQMKWNK